jgi:hypothetical protein
MSILARVTIFGDYFYAFQPEVTIYKAAGGYKMKVEGMDDTIYVRRLK